MSPRAIVKRDGRIESFDPSRIASAIGRALAAVDQPDPQAADELARVAAAHLARTHGDAEVGLEEVQDAAVLVLQESGHYQAAIAFARYRDDRERARRCRPAEGQHSTRLNLKVTGDDGRSRAWDAAALAELVARRYRLGAKAAADVAREAGALLASSACTELSASLVDSLVETALLRLGLHASAAAGAPLRLAREAARAALAGDDAAAACGRDLLARLVLSDDLPAGVARLHAEGRLWIDGLGDPGRGSQVTITVETVPNPYQVICLAATQALEAAARWRRIRLVLPPAILGHLERGAPALVPPLQALTRIAQVHLWCDGRTSLISAWPFAGNRLGLATFHDDFLLQRQMQERGLPLLSGPAFARPGHRARVAAQVALNAQGLEGDFSALDTLAMAAVAALRARMARLGDSASGPDAELRFAVFGLAATSSSSVYLEQQVHQEGLRSGLRLSRSSHLPEEACSHLGRLLA